VIKPPVRIAPIAVLAILLLALAPVASAAPPSGGGHGGSGGGGKGSCTPKTPGVVIDNNWQWGSPGSFGLPGQQLKYAIDVINYDVGCAASTFTVSVSAPSGFAVSIPASTVSLKSSSSGYAWAYVTSPSGSSDGDFPLIVTIQRAGPSNSTASASSYYKVYSSDGAAPTLYWPNPGDGSAISGRSYNVAVSSGDDHAVKRIELYIDNAYVSASVCDDIGYTCQLNYPWATTAGQHAATFKSYDWMGNVGVLTVSFTAG
jgi:hypothetical protein